MEKFNRVNEKKIILEDGYIIWSLTKGILSSNEEQLEDGSFVTVEKVTTYSSDYDSKKEDFIESKDWKIVKTPVSEKRKEEILLALEEAVNNLVIEREAKFIAEEKAFISSTLAKLEAIQEEANIRYLRSGEIKEASRLSSLIDYRLEVIQPEHIFGFEKVCVGISESEEDSEIESALKFFNLTIEDLNEDYEYNKDSLKIEISFLEEGGFELKGKGPLNSTTMAFSRSGLSKISN